MAKTIREIVEAWHAENMAGRTQGKEILIRRLEEGFTLGRTWMNGTVSVTELPATQRGGSAIQVTETVAHGIGVEYIHKEGDD